MNKKYEVILHDDVKKSLKKIPHHIKDKLLKWVDDVELEGIEAVRKIPSYHDEPLVGPRVGQRSIRLNKAYRAIYIEEIGAIIHIIIVKEVNKHAY